MIGKPIDKIPRPLISSYDSGYEHSVEHWFQLREMVEQQSWNLKESKTEAEAAETRAQAVSA